MIDEAAKRLQETLAYLKQSKIPYSHVYCLWCQGESDGDYSITAAQYKKNFMQIWDEIHAAGAETCFLIQLVIIIM